MNTQAAKLFSSIILSDKPVRIKLLGDSITHGHSGTGFAESGENFIHQYRRNDDGYCWANLMRDFLKDQYDCQVINNGCSGVRTAYLVENFDTLVDEADDLIICTIGTNDRAQYHKDGPKPTRREKLNQVYGDMTALAEKFQKINKPVIFVANIPAVLEADGSFNNQPYWRLIHMRDIHDLWFKLCCQRNLPFVDLYTAVTNYCDTRNIPLADLLADGLHPNDRGYEVMFRLLMEQLGIAVPGKGIQY